VNAVEQIVGRERRERFSQLAWCSEGALVRAAASTQPLYALSNIERNLSLMAERRLYIASILGIGTRGGIPDTRHVPVILDAERIADTCKEACEAENVYCPPNQYPLRHVVVRPIPVDIGRERREREVIADFQLPIVDLIRAAASTQPLSRI
jgi:hypothetical protein